VSLEEIAAGIEVVEHQRNRGVATTDRTSASLVDQLETAAAALPCTPEAAATILETHAAGTSVGESARKAGVVPITAAKVLHRCGADGVTPLSPGAREILRDWLTGELSRSEARALTGASEAEFALATYVETHDPHDRLSTVASEALTCEKRPNRNSLEGTLPEPDEFRETG
jgi:hypothetical protein